MNTSSARPRVRINSAAGLLAVIPHLLGFTPERQPRRGRRHRRRAESRSRSATTCPTRPDADTAAEIAGHALGVLAQQHLPVAVVVGYGPGRLVTPLADAFRAAAPSAGVRLHDVLRVEDGRYWSYLCTNPACCPAEGVVVRPRRAPGRPGPGRRRAAGPGRAGRRWPPPSPRSPAPPPRRCSRRPGRPNGPRPG